MCDMVTLAAVLLKNLRVMKHVFIITNASKAQKSLNDPHKPMPSTLNPKMWKPTSQLRVCSEQFEAPPVSFGAFRSPQSESRAVQGLGFRVFRVCFFLGFGFKGSGLRVQGSRVWFLF